MKHFIKKSRPLLPIFLIAVGIFFLGPLRSAHAATFVNDTFTGSNSTLLESHTGETGATWAKNTSANGAVSIDAANRIYASNANSFIFDYYASGAPATANYEVSATVTNLSVVSGSYFAVTGRASTTALTAYYFFCREDICALAKYVAGSVSGIANTTSMTLPADGTPHTIKLSMNGSTISGYLDGVLAVSATDTSITTAGKAGILGFGTTSTTTGVHFDSFSASDIVAPATTYTLTGPTTGFVGRATSFTVTPSGPYTGIITPATTGSGTFSPTSLSWTDDATAKTFTYTPTSSVGSPHTISASSSPLLTNPASISLSVSALYTNQIASDSFTGTNGTLLQSHTGELGLTWAKSAVASGASASIDSANRIYLNDAVNYVADYYASIVPATADYEVSADVVNLTATGYVGVSGRSSTSVATAYNFFCNNGSAGCNLYKYISGTGTLLASTSTGGVPTDGSTHTIKLSMLGSTIAGYVDGVQVISVTDTSITAPGRAGILGYGTTTTTTGTHIDSFSVSDLSTTPFVAKTTVTVNDVNWFWSPYNTYISGSSYALMLTFGAYSKFSFTGTSAAVQIDTSAFAGIASNAYPQLCYRVDGGAYSCIRTSTANTIVLASGLTSGTHTVHMYMVDNYATDHWTVPTSPIKITSLQLDQGSALVAPTILSKKAIFYGDSITAGGSVTDALLDYVPLMAAQLQTEFAEIGYSGQGWTQGAADGTTPGFTSTWNNYYSGQSRLSGGLFTPAPDYIFVNEGTNAGLASTATLTTWMTNARAAAGANTHIFVIVPFGQNGAANITTGFNNYVSANPSDTKVHILNLGVISYTTTDGIHPDDAGHALLAAALLTAMTPSAPTSLNATAGASQVGLTWNAATVAQGTPVTDYRIEYKLATEPTTWTTFSDGVSIATTATVTGLTNGLSYNFRVSAINDAGASSVSSTATATPVTVPSAPTSLIATSGNTQVSLSWVAPSNGGSALTDYIVQYKLSSEPTTWTTFSDGTSTTANTIVTGLSNGVSYDFRISAVNAVGTGSPSATATAIPATVPGAPTSVTAVAGDSQAAVSFTAPVSNGGSSITLYTVTSTPGSLTATGSGSPITVTGLTNGTSYTFTVTATNSVGTSSASTASSAITPVSPTIPVVVTPTSNGGRPPIGVYAPIQTATTSTNPVINPPSNTSPAMQVFMSSFVVLRPGVSNTNVKTLQQYLNTHGYIVASIGAGSPGKETSYFGPATKKALIKFQKANGLVADGILGPKTKAKMK